MGTRKYVCKHIGTECRKANEWGGCTDENIIKFGCPKVSGPVWRLMVRMERLEERVDNLEKPELK